MLESLSMPRYSPQGSDNASDAGDQQERPEMMRRFSKRGSVYCFGNPQRLYARCLVRGEDTVRAAWRHVEAGRNDWPPGVEPGVTNLSEVPCRVSSDLHEWRNDWTTVSTSDSVKL